MMKIIATGLSGLVGSRVHELLLPKYTFEGISRSTGTDITNKDQVYQRIVNSDASIVLHLAAKADVDGCEQDKAFGEEGEAWKTNVLGTQYIAAACEESNKKLVYISTDFVFSGEDTPRDGYSEEDVPHPINWYAQTKYEGEKIIQKANIPWVIARIAYPYRASFAKTDFMRSFLDAMKSGKKVQAITDRIIMPTFVDDIAEAIDGLITSQVTGIYHVTGSQKITFYDAVCLIAKTFSLDNVVINQIENKDCYVNRAKRPCNLFLKNDRIHQLDIQMKTFEEGIKEIKKQLLTI